MVIKKKFSFSKLNRFFFSPFFFIGHKTHTLFERRAALDKYLKTHTVNVKIETGKL